jgi:hypothetical protein
MAFALLPKSKVAKNYYIWPNFTFNKEYTHFPIETIIVVRKGLMGYFILYINL